MGRFFGLVGVFLVVITWSVGFGSTSRSPAAPFLMTGATDIEVVALGRYDWQISYQAPGSPTTWYADVVQQLEQDQWHSSDNPAYGPLNRTYMRRSSFGLGEVRQWVFVGLDPFHPQLAQLRLRRMVVFPWWQRLSRRAEQWRKVAEGWVQRGALLPAGMGALDEKDLLLDG